MLQVGTQVHNNLMSTDYVLVIVVGYWGTIVGKTDIVTPFWSLQSGGYEEFKRHLQGDYTTRWWESQNKISSHMVFLHLSV